VNKQPVFKSSEQEINELLSQRAQEPVAPSIKYTAHSSTPSTENKMADRLKPMVSKISKDT